MRIRITGALGLAALMLVACSQAGEPAPSGSPTVSPTETASPTATATPSSTATPSTTATATATPSTTASAACEPFGSLADQQPTDPLVLSTLTGKEVRVGLHPCYERFVFQMQGNGDRPGWSVGYRDPLIADPAGFEVDLRGDAALEVVVPVWTVTDFEGRPEEWPPFESPTTILTSGYEALLEVRYISAFEGITQFGLGVDRQRPFRVFWLDAPPRLVIDIATSP